MKQGAEQIETQKSEELADQVFEEVRKAVSDAYAEKKVKGIPPTELQGFFLRRISGYGAKGVPIKEAARWNWASLGGLFTRRLVTWREKNGKLFLVVSDED